MKKILLALGILTGTFAQAESINVSELTEKEQIIYRAVFCSAAGHGAGDLDRKLRKLAVKNIKVFNVIESNNFIVTDSEFDLNVKIRNDVAAMLMLGKLEQTEELFTQCNRDLLKILENTYVPNFTVIQNSN